MKVTILKNNEIKRINNKLLFGAICLYIKIILIIKYKYF